MNKFQRSWQLFKSSLTVMRRDKQLLLFPILTTACTMLVALLFLFPVAFQSTGHPWVSAAHWTAVGSSIYSVSGSGEAGSGTVEEPGYRHGRHAGGNGIRPLAVAYFAVIYFVSMFIATFFNVA